MIKKNDKKPLKKSNNKNSYDESVNVSKIKLSDKGSVRHAVFLNPERIEHIKRRMDGG